MAGNRNRGDEVLDKVAKRYSHNIEYRQLLMGGASIDVHGVPLTDETVAEAKSCDAVLMGSIGGNTSTSPWYKLEPSKRPRQDFSVSVKS